MFANPIRNKVVTSTRPIRMKIVCVNSLVTKPTIGPTLVFTTADCKEVVELSKEQE
jgi:hypothetical protein